VAIALPTLEAMLPRSPARAATETSPLRFVTWFQPGGAVLAKWMPSQANPFTLGPTLAPLELWKSHLLQISGLRYSVAEAGKYGHPHYRGLAACLTGQQLAQGNHGIPDGAGGDPTGYAEGPSLDLIIARKIQGNSRFRSLDINIRHDGPVPPNPATNSLYDGPDRPRTGMVDPVELWDRLFKDVSVGGMKPSVLAHNGKSVLDFAVAECEMLRRKVSGSDRERLDQHCTELRGVETRLSKLAQASGASCTPGNRPPKTVFSSQNMEALGQVFMDMAVLALTCDATRVVNLQWGDPRSRYTMPWIGLDQNHHFYQHDGGFRPVECAQVEHWYAKQFAYFLDKLEAFKDPDGTLLSKSLVYSASEISHADAHSLDNIPILLAGSLGGKVKTGRFIRSAPRSHIDLLIAIQNAFGIESQTFGKPGFSQGPMSGLT
jgi:hypothetical protein